MMSNNSPTGMSSASGPKSLDSVLTTPTVPSSTSTVNNDQQQSYNSLVIRLEVQRFESVHPSIYQVYDLLDLVQEPMLAGEIRQHILCIEDAFVNSQEWTMSKNVPDLRVGIIGSLSSGKSALVHRYLTGSYMQDESPEGGRFKKEVTVDGHSYLLLIRDEGGSNLTDMQFSCWVDAVIFVFSVMDETSFNAVQTFYSKMSQYRSMKDIPLLLVGTVDSISDSSVRVVDEARAKRYASDLKCSYFETSATRGFNVEKVFQEDYMNNVHGKEIPLKHTTVKVPGQLRMSKASNADTNDTLVTDLKKLSMSNATTTNGSVTTSENSLTLDEKLIPSTNPLLAKDKLSFKKRHRRHKSITGKNDSADDANDYEFVIVSLENKVWKFEAENQEERDGWVSDIEQLILNSLQLIESDKSRRNFGNSVDKSAVQAIRKVGGNTRCVDCDAANPDWASLNLGALMCIECSGTHRNIGTHVCRVRSLDLDEWPPSHVSVMMALGNIICDRIYEARILGKTKPTPTSNREAKENWIRSKYEQKEFIQMMVKTPGRLEQMLFDAVVNDSVVNVATYLAHGASPNVFNNDRNTPLNLACSNGNLAIVQLLLWANADIRATDAVGRTALFYSNKQEIKDLLKSVGLNEATIMSPTNPNAAATNNSTAKDTLTRRTLSSLSPKSEVFDKLPASAI